MSRSARLDLWNRLGRAGTDPGMDPRDAERIVEDNALNRKVISGMLAARGRVLPDSRAAR